MKTDVLKPARYSDLWFGTLSAKEYRDWRRALTFGEAKSLSVTQLAAWKKYLGLRLEKTTDPAYRIWAADATKEAAQAAFTEAAVALLEDYCFVCDRLLDCGVHVEEEGTTQ